MTNAMTFKGRMEITSVSQINDLAKDLPEGFHVLVVFDYRVATTTNNKVFPREAMDQKKWCEKVGAQRDNHQVVVCIEKCPIYNNKWVIVHFSDFSAYATEDLENLRVNVNPW